MGDIYADQGEHAKAERSYRKAAEVEPRSFDAQFKHGLVLQILNRVSESVRAYLRALAVRPNDFEANRNLATAYLQLEEPAQALVYAERAIELDPEDGPARVNLGAVYAALDRHADAVTAYQAAAERMELTAELLLNLADSLGKVHRHEEMLNTLDRLLTLAPSAQAHERRGFALFRLRRYDEALAAFQTSAETDDRHYPAHNGVAVCKLNGYEFSDRENDGLRREAVEALRRSLRIKQDQPRIADLLNRYQ